ncbi:hypothetical protein BpHYR1_005549 [Brachionus plicatilis]|uniref:Uncharacterized protein n=1 Tax=Brachionus plicatilis TaxID=10195 RepID=A0A3M7SGD5_BRAPC|nr:hypothetical protein BpHYR1_005549 [Brachionus plicatilis]
MNLYQMNIMLSDFTIRNLRKKNVDIINKRKK